MFATIRKNHRKPLVFVSALILTAALTGCGNSAKNNAGDTVDPGCPAVDGSAPTKRVFAAEPPTCISAEKIYNVVMETSKGTMEFLLDQKRAPKTVNSFVFLARQHYFDGILFHRVVPDFVLQGGDPNTLDNGATAPIGSGGPGYTIVDEFPKAGEYKFGSLVMAKTPAPNSSGSQFFIISGAGGIALPPEYSLFGQATKGDDVIKAIGALGVSDGPPSEPVTITKVTITET